MSQTKVRVRLSAVRRALVMLAVMLVVAALVSACSSNNQTSVASVTGAPTTSATAPTASSDGASAATSASSDPETDTELSAPGSTPASDLATSVGAVLPDLALTPGDVFPVGADQVCVSGYSSSVRNVSTSTKNDVYAEYHIYTHTTGQYEVDHLIPLELGGSNDIKNLWPEPADPRPGFHEKDQLENKLHALVCAGSLDLGTAQVAIRTNWWDAYVQYDLGGVVPAPQPVTPIPAIPSSAPGLPVPASGVAFTSVVGGRPGGVASATVQTSPGASCSISYVTPAGTHSQAQGLVPETAGGDGVVSWSWNIGSNTHPGTGTVSVACDGVSASAAITIG